MEAILIFLSSVNELNADEYSEEQLVMGFTALRRDECQRGFGERFARREERGLTA